MDAIRPHRIFITVSMDLQPDGFNVACWMSTEQTWLLEADKFPHSYSQHNGECETRIRANMELTWKVVAMVAETADKICTETIARNSKRKLANR